LNRGVIIDNLGVLSENEIVFVHNEEGGFVLSTGRDELTNDIIQFLRKHGVRGGGKGNTVMGSFDSKRSFDDLITEFSETIK